MGKISRPEQEIQKAVADLLFLTEKKNGFFWFAVPNGGYRSKIEASIMKGLGTRAGVPDICIIKHGRAYWIELKSPIGKLSDAQKKMMLTLHDVGCLVAVCRSIDDVQSALKCWGIVS